ncbi:MAG: IS1634 family transposase, partial [bacterium]
FNLIRSKEPGSLESVFYDLSSSTFSGSRCILSKWGHCKEGFKTHVVLALVVDKNGYPFYWEVLAGNTADTTTILGLVEKLSKRFKITNSTLVFDRGMVSDENLRLLEGEDIKYISALDRNQVESVSGFNFSSLSDLKLKEKEGSLLRYHNFTRFNGSTYFKEIRQEGKRRYILCFNPQLFKDQQDARLKSIEDFKEFVRLQNQELRQAVKSRNLTTTKKRFDKEKKRRKLNHIVEITLNEIHIMRRDSKGVPQRVRTYQAQVTIDEQELRSQGQIDGFWMLVTNHIEKEKALFEISSEDIITPYQDKHIIEAAFRDIKSFVEIAPIHVWTDEHVKAHYTICVLAYLINRTITRRLHENPGKQTADVITHETLYEAVDDCKVDEILVKNIGLKFCSITELNHIQKELLIRVGIDSLIANPGGEELVLLM